MRFTIATVLALAAGALAAPQLGGSPGVGNDVTVGQAGDNCGQDLELSCCNNVKQSGDSTSVASGLLAGTLGGILSEGEVGLFSGCSKLNVAARTSNLPANPQYEKHCELTHSQSSVSTTCSTASASRPLPAASTPVPTR